MGFGSSPKTPPTPGKRPEREVEVEPEDIKLGGEEALVSDLKTKGKRSLLKPSGGKVATGVNV